MAAPLHSWHLTPTEAVALQNEMRSQVRIQPLEREPQLIGGADISFDKYSDVIHAGIVVLRYPSMDIVEETGIVGTATFPYIPGLLSFRESPALLEVWGKLKNKPDVLILDGQGTAHPRRLGIACHIGLWLQIPTIGCAKTLLSGRFEDLGNQRGAWAPLVHRKEIVGAALRTKDNTTPVYISPGHLINLEDSVRLALHCGGGYRIPEPTRRAHLFVNRLRRGEDSPSALQLELE